MSKKYSIYLFNQDNPTGKMFNLTDEEIAEHQEAGWLDSPATLDLPESDDTGLTHEQVENARPEDLIKMIESFGFIVMTKDQLKAEANKMAALVLDITKFDDSEIIAEAERRGLKDSSDIKDKLYEVFEGDPKSLTKKELVELGQEFDVSLHMNMLEQTMIDKISEAIEEKRNG